MIGKFVRAASSVVLVLAIAGCSVFAPQNQTITISGEPASAAVMVNGNHVTVPATMLVKRNQNINIVVSKKGYRTHMMSGGFSLSTFGILDIIGGCIFLVPFVGLLTPGAYTLDQDHFHFVLSPEEN